MSTDSINIGPVPYEESCAQTTDDDFQQRSRIECNVFKRQIERCYPMPDGVAAAVVVCSFEHDFGTYREVCVQFDPDDSDAVDWAYLVDEDPDELLVNWDGPALKELHARLVAVGLPVYRKLRWDHD